jgi:hypothetical protein
MESGVPLEIPGLGALIGPPDLKLELPLSFHVLSPCGSPASVFKTPVRGHDDLVGGEGHSFWGKGAIR